MSVEEKVLQHIESFPKGHLFFAADFSELGSAEAVRVALFRLEKKGSIARAAQGIYVRPKECELLGKLRPSAEAVAEAIIKRDCVRTLPTGSMALNALGLSTQVPANLVFLTDGSPRKINVGRRTITFIRTSPKNLMTKGKISRLAIQALKAIGNGLVREDEERKIIELLKKENENDLRHDIAFAPVWIQKIMRKAVENRHDL